MNILCITHADFEKPGVIEDWARDRQFSFKIEKPYKGEQLSSMDAFDFLLVMGGPQSVRFLDSFPYLKDEIALVQRAIAQGKRVLGFCLGAQLIGEAMGGVTEKGPEKEIGVYPISLTDKGLDDPLLAGFPETFNVIHWHNDMPGLTASSEILATSAGCPRQIVKYGEKIYGFQCHMEITHEGIKEMINAVPEDLEPSLFTQTESQLLANDYAPINQDMITILDRFVTL